MSFRSFLMLVVTSKFILTFSWTENNAAKKIIRYKFEKKGKNKKKRQKEYTIMKTNWLDYTLLTLVIVGAVNWGLIGFFRFDLVAFLFGDLSWLSRIIYALVGIGGLYAISFFGRINNGEM